MLVLHRILFELSKILYSTDHIFEFAEQNLHLFVLHQSLRLFAEDFIRYESRNPVTFNMNEALSKNSLRL